MARQTSAIEEAETNYKPLTILTMLTYYEPGYKAGGQITAIQNTIAHLGQRFRFKVLTSDRDLGDKEPYALPLNEWIIKPSHDIYYIAAARKRELIRIMNTLPYDILYINSFFSPHYAIKPIVWQWLFRRPGIRIIVAPRGEFAPDALALKPFKKRCYILLARALGFYRQIVWQAGNEQEAGHIRAVFGSSAAVKLAADLPAKPIDHAGYQHKTKHRGKLRMVFLSRIARIKNLDYALRTLEAIHGEVHFAIYGPIEDAAYWAQCQQIIAGLPANISVEYGGVVSHNQASAAIGSHQLLFLPSRGESFGHVIFEALSAGCPVLLSDRTPWHEVAEQDAGHIWPLANTHAFRQSIQQFVDMEAEEYNQMGMHAYTISRTYMGKSDTIQDHVQLFHSV